MAKVLITEDYLSDIGDAIRGKLGGSTQYTPGQMASAISSIPTVAPTLISKSIVANGTYNASSDEADGYDSVSVNVPNTYSAQDEGKVVSSGALVAQESQNVSQNGTYDTTLKNEVVVNVPNSYSAGDEGKVVSSGALVSQTSATKTENGTYDTTLNNEIVVAVPDPVLVQKAITENGTYNPASDNADGYSSVFVNISGGGGSGIPLFSRSEWNALTKQQKLSYGLVAIQDSITGYGRGDLVSGEDYTEYLEAEIVPKYSWNVSSNSKNTYVFTGTTNANKQTSTCLAITSQNGSNPSSDSSLTTLREGTSGNGSYKIFYDYFSNNGYADTYSRGNNWNNSEIVCFEFYGEPTLTIKELFYEQGGNGTYTYTYQPTEKENLFLVFLRGGSAGNAVSITGLTQKSYVTSTGARINGVYYDTVNSGDTINISIPYASGNNTNGSLLVVLFSIE